MSTNKVWIVTLFEVYIPGTVYETTQFVGQEVYSDFAKAKKRQYEYDDVYHRSTLLESTIL